MTCFSARLWVLTTLPPLNIDRLRTCIHVTLLYVHAAHLLTLELCPFTCWLVCRLWMRTVCLHILIYRNINPTHWKPRNCPGIRGAHTIGDHCTMLHIFGDFTAGLVYIYLSPTRVRSTSCMCILKYCDTVRTHDVLPCAIVSANPSPAIEYRSPTYMHPCYSIVRACCSFITWIVSIHLLTRVSIMNAYSVFAHTNL